MSGLAVAVGVVVLVVLFLMVVGWRSQRSERLAPLESRAARDAIRAAVERRARRGGR